MRRRDHGPPICHDAFADDGFDTSNCNDEAGLAAAPNAEPGGDDVENGTPPTHDLFASLASMIRHAAAADIPALAALEVAFPTDRMSARNFQDLLRRCHGSVLVYEEQSAVLGDAVVLYRRNSAKARIYSLVVAPAQRGRGIARQLLIAVEADARAHHSRTLSLEVRPDNAQALRLYGHLGYTVERQLERFYEDGSPALRLSKVL